MQQLDIQLQQKGQVSNMTIRIKKPNIYDIGALILIIALCAAAYIKFGIIEHTKTDTQMSKIVYSLEFMVEPSAFALSPSSLK